MNFQDILRSIKNYQVQHRTEKQFKRYLNSPQRKFTRLYGYRTDGTVVESEAIVIRLINKLICSGYSLEETKRYLDITDGRYRNRSRNKFSIFEILSIATKVIYSGYLKSPNGSKLIKSEIYPPILSIDDFKACQKALQKSKNDIK